MRTGLKNFKCDKNAETSAADLMNKYGNMSEEALFAALMQEVASSKSNGTFDADALAENVAKMRPFLSDSQNEKLSHLLGLIRN